uniref:HRDC domain-containing protein n=1 Tax=Hemiselmis andersenii TaxID=464988 RepID=A0A6U4JC75_HEMAN
MPRKAKTTREDGVVGEKGDSGHSGISSYEQVRLDNIKRNGEILKSLGIDAVAASLPMRNPAVAKARRASSDPHRPRATREKKAAGEPQRRSSRLSGASTPAKLEVLEHFLDSSDEETEWTSWDKSRVNALPSHKTHLDAGERVVFEALYEHRQAVAEKEGFEAYMVAQNRSLCEMVRMRPQDAAEMVTVWGMGEKRVEKYGQAFLEILAANSENLRTGQRPVLDAPEHEEGVVQSTAAQAEAGGARRVVTGKGVGYKWKGKLTWDDLDSVGAGPGRLVLRHNASHVYTRSIAEGDSMSGALQALARAGKKTGNPKITGFIKVVDNTFFNDLPLSVVLEEFVNTRR